jgi:hypothetical protein
MYICIMVVFYFYTRFARSNHKTISMHGSAGAAAAAATARSGGSGAVGTEEDGKAHCFYYTATAVVLGF